MRAHYGVERVQAGSPRSCKRHAWTIRELPGLEVAGRLKLVLCLIVSKRTIERELSPVITIAERKILTPGDTAGSILFR